MKSNPPPAGQGSHRDPARERTWRRLLKQFDASGQSIRTFCAARRLKETGFYFWRAEIRRRDGQAPPRSTPPRSQRLTPHYPTPHRPTLPGPAFAQVLVQPPILPAAEQTPRLRLAGGRELLLPASYTPRQLAAVVHAIEEAV